MAQAMVNFRIDEDLKREMEQTCKNMGLTMTSAFTMFATKVTREQRIPFEINMPSICIRLSMHKDGPIRHLLFLYRHRKNYRT